MKATAGNNCSTIFFCEITIFLQFIIEFYGKIQHFINLINIVLINFYLFIINLWYFNLTFAL